MTRYLPWVFLLACPLMMLFMMRGMGGGRRSTDNGKPTSGRDDVLPVSLDKTAPQAMPHAGDAQARIAQLEFEVAQLRAAREANPGDTSVLRR